MPGSAQGNEPVASRLSRLQGVRLMYVWEMIACRLRGEGWSVWHATMDGEDGVMYLVHFHRPGFSGKASGITLTDAYAEAARRARDCQGASRPLGSPHF